MRPRSLPIILIGWLFVAVGCVSLVSHGWRMVADSAPGGAGGVRGRDLPDVLVAMRERAAAGPQAEETSERFASVRRAAG